MLGDGKGWPLDFFLSPGQMADSRGALVLLRHLPTAKHFLGDKAHDADWLRDGLNDPGIRPCIPPRKKAKNRLPTTSASTGSDTASRTPLAA